MPIFIIERNYAEQLEVTPEWAAAFNQINDQESVRWLISFLSVVKKKTFCLYETASVENIREAAKRSEKPADVIIEQREETASSGETKSLLFDRCEKPILNY